MDIKTFFEEQLNEWLLAKQNYDALNRVKVKELDLGGCAVRVQFNPERIRSTAAKVDAASLRERPCFLCRDNRPNEQRDLYYNDKYSILINPFPIFPVHLTIPTIKHVDQLIFNSFEDMLDIAKDLDDFVVFYNGPKSGASAPDHMHFQAGNKGFLPLEKDVVSMERIIISDNDDVICFSLKDYHRNMIALESDNKVQLISRFQKIYEQLEIKSGEPEPMLNVVIWYDDKKWFCCIFPRKKHRPNCFYAEGEDNLLFSPASVDLSGVCVLPQEKDFEKITAEDVIGIFEEI
ncbi:MAG: DUF4922 domain-containing protein [Bacteroidales bacterium 36-12]|jgi:ATP adenylyltransferase/5',5'''-P-1,P-4-tetraphosphate phosphorylase II|nr:MAG: DUF4922 domain-containing protein [Bacteroidales bacterium 36-12]